MSVPTKVAEVPDSPELVRLAYSVAEAAKMLGCSRKTIYNWEQSGKLRLVRIGRLVRVTHADLQKALVAG